ncbi:MAG TPA: glucose-6-phosphate dehydrogenase [Xanthobacteraceae bacterium]|jgi:glucose-6-phosphate 1-dehydrogenase|nr:glucose-6-phosphate dehydrogenase [Xanthobacteraceae bacterium]
MDERTSEAWCAKLGAGGAKPAPSCAIVIFGMGGDLTRRLLIPALYNLSCWGLLPDGIAIVGVGHSDIGIDELCTQLEAGIRAFSGNAGFNRAAWDRIARNLDYIKGEFEDPATYRELAKRLSTKTKDTGENVLFYLAVAEKFFAPVVLRLADVGLTRAEHGWRRVIVEKPFGHDVASARALNRTLLSVLSEDQIYRIDHFLGKETVQNILVVRFANGFFEPIWNRDHIDHVQITVAETVGVEQRGAFYEPTGALRDMVPNHLFQLLSLTAMEPPIALDANAVRSRKQDVLKTVRPFTEDDARRYAVRAQYDAGVSAGKPVKGYRDEARVNPHSTTETYCALSVLIDNWRWAGVPFYLRTGKRLTRRQTEIAIAFKRAPHLVFDDGPVGATTTNWLVLHLQPDEGMSLHFDAKVPGPAVRLGNVHMDFLYKDYFHVAPSTGYETLVYDCMIGDQMLFQGAESIEAAWSIVQPIADVWSEDREKGLVRYSAGSPGPLEADKLLESEGRHWRPLDRNE